MIQKLRSFVMDLSCGASEWINLRLLVLPSSSLRFSFGWWFEKQFMTLFGIAYRGSEEELDAVENGEIPRKYMSQRQREFSYQAAREGILFDEVTCLDCGELLLVSDEIDICAQCRALHPEMLLEDAKS
jgi:hypothetical protein